MSAEENLKAVEVKTQGEKETIEIGGSIKQLAEKYDLDLSKFQEWLEQLNKWFGEREKSFFGDYNRKTVQAVRSGIAEVMDHYLTNYFPKVYLQTGVEGELKSAQVVQAEFDDIIREGNIVVNGLLNDEIKEAVSGDYEDVVERIGQELPDASLVAMATDLVLYSGLKPYDIEALAFGSASVEEKGLAIRGLYEKHSDTIKEQKDDAISRHLEAAGSKRVHRRGVSVASAR